jgi:hypothetical protein
MVDGTRTCAEVYSGKIRTEAHQEERKAMTLTVEIAEDVGMEARLRLAVALYGVHALPEDGAAALARVSRAEFAHALSRSGGEPQRSGRVGAARRTVRTPNTESLLAMLDSFAAGDEDEQRETLTQLQVDIDHDRPGQRSIFGEGLNPALDPSRDEDA